MKTFLRFSVLAFFAVFWGHGAVTFGELQVHLKLDGDLVDSAGSDHNGMLLNGARGGNPYVSGKLGEALDLANGDHTTGENGVSIKYTMTDSGTVALW